MSFFDDDPPKHLDVGSLTKGKNYNIYTSERGRKCKYNLYLTLEETKALITHEGKTLFSVHTNSKKVYEAALQARERAKEYIKNGKMNEDESEIGR